jgi:hypothetical protein
VGKSAVERFLTDLERQMARREHEERVTRGRSVMASAAFKEMTVEILDVNRRKASSRSR